MINKCNKAFGFGALSLILSSFLLMPVNSVNAAAAVYSIVKVSMCDSHVAAKEEKEEKHGKGGKEGEEPDCE